VTWAFSSIAAGALAIGGMAVRTILGAKKPAPLPPCCEPAQPPAPAPAPPPGPLAGLWRRLRRLLARPLHGAAPWVLLTGVPASGKTSLAQSALAALEPEVLGSAPPSFDGADCHRFAQGLLIDADGKLDGAGWVRLLDQIEARRPRRPLDGLLLAVPASLLMDAPTATVVAAAAELRRRLYVLQQRQQWVLPVYVVVTGCDLAAGPGGYRGATGAIPAREMIGWSAPEVGDYAGAERWSASAFDQLARRFRQCQLQAAQDPAAPLDDEAFLLPHRLQGLRGALAAWLAAAFEPTAPQPGLMLRGIYFSGAAGTPPARPADPRADVSAVADLLTAKVLAERNLAYPLGAARDPRRRAPRLRLWSAALLVALLAAALALGAAALRRDAVQFEVSLRAIADRAALPQTTTCLEKERVTELLGLIARAPVPNYPPWSLLDRRLREDGARRIAATALDKAILPALACKLKERADALLTPEKPEQPYPPLPPAGSVTSVQGSLLGYLDQVLALEQDYKRLRQVSVPAGAADPAQALQALRALLGSLYGLEGQPRDGGMLVAALSRVSLPPPSPPPHAKFQDNMHELQKRLSTSLLDQLTGGRDAFERLSAGSEKDWAPDLLDNARHSYAWLNWVQGTLLPATVERNPCQDIASGLARRQAELADFGYLLQSPAGQPFSATACFGALQRELAQQTLPRYGRLIDDKGGRAAPRLNPALAAEMAGLGALITQDFMQLVPSRTFRCLTQDTDWEPETLQRARDFARDYQLFARQSGGEARSPRPLFVGVARRQLELVMNETLDAAQSAAAQRQDLAGAEARLARRSAGFASVAVPLTGLADLYRQLGMNGSAGQLLECVGSQAADALSQTGELAERSRLYMPQAAPPGGAPFDLGGAGSLADYLAVQVARVQVLGGYASPYLQVLQDHPPPDQTRRSASQKAPYWINTLKELAQYQAHDNSGEAGKLHSLIARQVADNDAGPCTAADAAAPALSRNDNGNDLFSARRRALARQLDARCGTRARSQWGKDYASLADAFNMHLAGRYPFAALTADDLPKPVLKQFFDDYGTLLASVRADGDKPAAGGTGKVCGGPACDFLHQLDDLRKALAPLLQNGAPVRVAATFNVRPGEAAGVGQIVVWTLSSGAATIGPPNRQPGALDWPVGEAISFDLAWADRSAWRPLADRRQPDLSINGTSAQFGYSGEWALLRLIERHRVPDGAPGLPLTLAFEVPLAREDARPAASATGQARMYLSLGLSTIDSKTRAETPLKLPSDFPHFAPR
jgi:type VI secretion system protein ImpL